MTYDLEKHFEMTHDMTNKKITITMPQADVTAYITDVDVDPTQESLVSRFLPSNWKSENQNKLISEGIRITKEEAIENNDKSIDYLRRAAERKAEEAIKMLI